MYFSVETAKRWANFVRVSCKVPRGTAGRTIACTSTYPPTDRKRWSASFRKEGAGGGGSWAQRWATSPNSWTCLGVERPPLTRSSLTGPRKKAPLWDCCVLHWLASRGPTWWQRWTAPRRVSLWSDSPWNIHVTLKDSSEELLIWKTREALWFQHLCHCWRLPLMVLIDFSFY